MINKYLNKITQGNSLEILKQLPNKSIDMILVDPPYFKNMNKKMAKPETLRLNKTITKSMMSVMNLNSSITPNDWWEEAIRVSKKINWIIYLDYRHQLDLYLELINKYGFSYYMLPWNKINPTPISNVYLRDFELAIYVYNKSPIDCMPNDFQSRKTITSCQKKLIKIIVKIL